MNISGERVRLRLMQQEDAAALFGIYESAPGIWRYMTRPLSTGEDMEGIVSEALAEYRAGTSLPFVVEEAGTGRIIGSTRLYDISRQRRALELGSTYYLPEVHRTGVNTECKLLLLTHAFEEMGMLRVQLKTDGRNTGAQKAIARIGAKKEGVLRNERELPDGYVRDAVVYSIIREEWPAVKTSLHKRLSK